MTPLVASVVPAWLAAIDRLPPAALDWSHAGTR